MLSHHRIIRRLKSYGISDIKIYKFRKWNIGSKRKKMSFKKMRFYYKARYNNSACFIKMGNNNSTSNEITINKYLDRCSMDFIPSLLLSDEDFSKSTVLIVTEYISNLKKIKVPDDIEGFRQICTELEVIHEKLMAHNIIHGDLSDSNLSMTKDNRIMLIDFGYGWIPGMNKNTFLRTIYKKTSNANVYCNAHNFLRVLDEIGTPDNFKQEECYKRLERLVGLHTLAVPIAEGDENNS